MSIPQLSKCVKMLRQSWWIFHLLLLLNQCLATSVQPIVPDHALVKQIGPTQTTPGPLNWNPQA